MRTRRSKGFTLLEAMVVLVVVGVIAAISLDMLTGQAKAEARRQMVSQQAIEMATIDRAVNQWVTNGAGLPTVVGDILEVNLLDVADAGFLPESFAERVASGSTTPVSPLGIPYRAFVRLTDSATFEVVTLPAGPVNPGFAARAGVSDTPESLRTFNVAVMQEIRAEHKIPSGVVNEGQTAVDAASSGFSVDLASFLGGASADMVVAALSNFAELETVKVDSGLAANPNEFVGKTCRPTSGTCASGEKEASAYRTCLSWGLHRQSGLPHQSVGEVFVTPIGNIQITKFTNITDLNSVSTQAGQLDGNPPATSALNATNTGAVALEGFRNIFDWQGNYVGYAVNCRHPNGTVWECVPYVSLSNNVNINQQWVQFSMSPMPSQIVSGAISQFGPTVSESAASREIVWSNNHFNTSNWRRTGERPACAGSVRAVSSPLWTQDLELRRGFVGDGTPDDGKLYGLPGTFLYNNIGPSPAYGARFNQGPVGPAVRVTYSETTQIPGQSPITTVCEENVLSNATSVPNPRTSGWAGASIGSGTNACPTSSLVARFGSTNYTLRSGRAFETFQFRPADSEQPVIRICCK